MKFLHLGDLHIGKIVNDFNMIDDQKYILNQIIDYIKEYEVDGLLIAGDVYDKAVPSEEAVKVFDEFICRLAKEKMPTFIISGNHDSDERMNFGSSLFQSSDIYITSKFNGALQKQVLQKGEEKVNIYMLPYVKASQVKKHFPKEKIENYEDAVGLVIQNARLNRSEKNILIAHQFVAGREGQVNFGGSENLVVQNVGTIEKIAYDLFDDFNYVALGHIHSPQKVGREEVRYAGSPLAYSLKEADKEKTVPLVEITEDGAVHIELLPLTPRRKLRSLKGKLINLIDLKNITDPDDYIFVTLTDEDMVSNVVNIVREYYPNLMKLEYDNSHSKEIMQVDLKDLTRGKNFTELIAEFYQTMYGCDISEEEMDIMREVAREAGVIHEAN